MPRRDASNDSNNFKRVNMQLMHNRNFTFSWNLYAYWHEEQRKSPMNDFDRRWINNDDQPIEHKKLFPLRFMPCTIFSTSTQNKQNLFLINEGHDLIKVISYLQLIIQLGKLTITKKPSKFIKKFTWYRSCEWFNIE